MSAASAAALLGVAGLATEAGSWYLTHRNARNAADAAALAGVRVLADTGDAQRATSAAMQVARENGFEDGSLQVTVTPIVQSMSPARMTVRVQQVQPLLFSRLFLDGPPRVGVTSGAEAFTQGGGAGACALTLGGATSFSGSMSLTAQDCAFVSNARPSSFHCNSSSGSGSYSVSVWGVFGAGNAGSCGTAAATTRLSATTRAFLQRPAADTLGRVQIDPITSGYSAGTNSNTQCLEFGTQDITGVGLYQAQRTSTGAANPQRANNTRPYCAPRWNALGQNNTIDLAAGIFYVQGPFEVPSNGSLTCSTCGAGQGVNIVVVAPASGNLRKEDTEVRIAGTIDLRAGRTTSAAAALNGVLLYVRGDGDVTITAGASQRITGAIYAPRSAMMLTGNSSGAFSPEDCMVAITHSLQFDGGGGMEASGCRALYGSELTPVVRLARLVS